MKKIQNTKDLNYIIFEHNLKIEEIYLKSCWKQCIEDKIKLPVDSVRIYNDNGELVSVQTQH